MKKRYLPSFAISMCGLTLIALACESKKKDDAAGTGGKMTLKFLQTKLTSASLNLADEVLQRDFGFAPQYLNLAGSSQIELGQSTTSSLESLSYRPGYIVLCNDVTLNGSGWTNPLGTWEIFNDTEEFSDTPENAVSSTKHVNLLDKDTLTKLGQELTYTSAHILKYNYALMNWSRGIRFKASVKLSDGKTIYSKKATVQEFQGGNTGNKQYSSSASSLTTGPAEETLVFSNNGGTVFKLQSPFEITQADYDAKTNFKLAFAFDSDGLVKGLSNSSEGPGVLTDSAGYQLQAPYLDIAPVAARESETIMRETYLLRNTDLTNTYDIKLSLYYVEEDTGHGIRAVNKTIHYTKARSQAATGALARIDSITTNADGTVTFNDSMDGTVLASFKRLTTVGTSGTVSAGYCKSGVTTCAEKEKYAYTLISVGSVEATLVASAATPNVTPTP